ncbi:MAG: hypothetical protein ACYCWW_00695, partial [Deltaproteobacteria bacterium]
LFRRGEPQAARLEWARAAVDGPGAVDWERLADPEVAALPSIATSEYQVEGDAVGWVAAVGTVEGLFPWPTPRLFELSRAAETLPAGLRFHRLLCDERAARPLAERAALRRALKALCPPLLAAYLERWR